MFLKKYMKCIYINFLNIMCKNIIKKDKDTTFKNLQNAYKEFEILQFINHPCICKSIGINTQEQYGDENITTIS